MPKRDTIYSVDSTQNIDTSLTAGYSALVQFTTSAGWSGTVDIQSSVDGVTFTNTHYRPARHNVSESTDQITLVASRTIEYLVLPPVIIMRLAVTVTGGSVDIVWREVPTHNTPVQQVEFSDSGLVDAFGHLRVSEDTALFESKLLHDKQPLYWDEAITNNSTNATSTHVPADAEVEMYVEATDVITRQTFRRFNYQPGVSQHVIMTGILGTGGTGVTARLGLFDDDNGMYFNMVGTTAGIAVLKDTCTETVVEQSNWNLDTMDGNGPSGINLDFSTTQIFIIDFQWLGAGRIRFGFGIGGRTVYCHEVLNSNVNTSVYASTPNLPLRYYVTTTSAAYTLTQVCSTVISETGGEPKGAHRYISTNGTHVDADVADTIYALVGMRLKSTHLDLEVFIEHVSVIAETNDDFEWILYIDPTVAGTFTYSGETNSGVEVARGATVNTVTGGTAIDGGFAKQDIQAQIDITNNFSLGSKIDGTAQEFVLCVRPLAANANVQGAISYREL